MANQYRNDDYRRGGRRDWNANDEGRGWRPERFGAPPRERRGWRSQGDGDAYTDDEYRFDSPPSGYGRGTDFGGRGSEFDTRPFESGRYGEDRDRQLPEDGRYGRERDFGGYGRESAGSWEGRRGWQESEPWQSASRSFGGQRGYARDLYSDSGASRHETDWESGMAGRSLRSVYSRPGGSGSSYRESGLGRSGGGWRSGVTGDRAGRSNFGDAYGSTFARYRDESGWSGRAGFAGRGPKDYQRSDDRIREEISDRMTDDDMLDASDITVQVRQGEVTLSGTVRSREEKRRAEDLAESVTGVREVTNNIRMAREPNGPDLTQSGSIQAGQTGQGSKTKSGTTGATGSGAA